jgi:hypothetical protein
LLADVRPLVSEGASNDFAAVARLDRFVHTVVSS